ncbi:NosD domain-containing protein [Jannaschia sp. M317]|uniref:NosD domain-containing protein n=1 Tax=Jannaschia sp. M317 TaxID=2867011 RepID=UPI0021A49987|nr:NosD domain-containing protein [Jannaschia sp. M317]UWQ19665.1 right-handed parallel beta-helix repeat-containing protein [Jannaschia sp. M317]
MGRTARVRATLAASVLLAATGVAGAQSGGSFLSSDAFSARPAAPSVAAPLAQAPAITTPVPAPTEPTLLLAAPAASSGLLAPAQAAQAPVPAPAAPTENTLLAAPAPTVAQAPAATALLAAPVPAPAASALLPAPAQAAPAAASGLLAGGASRRLLDLPKDTGPVAPQVAPAFLVTPRPARPDRQAEAPAVEVEDIPHLAPIVVSSAEAAMPPALDRTAQARLRELVRRLSDPHAELPTDAELRAVAGLPPREAAAAPYQRLDPMPAAAARVFNLRLALAMLSQGRTKEDNEKVRAVQLDRGDTVLSLSGGLVTLSMIHEGLARTGLQTTPGPIEVPLILMEDTVLRLGPGEELALSRPHGAFVMSFGRVEIDGATIASRGGENERAPSYAPFVAIAGSGSLEMRRATVTGLGFGDTDKFAGLSVLGHPLRPATRQTVILDSQLSDMVGVALTAIHRGRISGNRFTDMRGNALRVAASPRTEVSENIFAGTAPTNSIRLLSHSDGARLTSNLLLAGDRAGIVVRDSRGPQVLGNVVWGRSGAGVKLHRTACAQVAGNVLIDSRQKGIEIRESRATEIAGNLIAGNRSAGIWVSAQARDAATHLRANRLQGNGAGLTGATAAHVTLVANDFSAQLPRLADGDLTQASTALARDLTGTAPLTLSGSTRVPAAIVDCSEDAA